MCDSFVALGNSTADGSVLLAKSADTEVNEAEHVVRFPRRQYRDGAMVRVTHMNIPQAPLTYEIILGKSFWSWGAEIGCNEHGVAIGNEAAFSNQKDGKDGVVVLDLLRLALERATTAREGVDVVGHHVETFGESGNCQMMGNYWFDAGLLIADRREAWVVNCAGRNWAARPVSDVMAISNRYQIGTDWTLSSLKANGSKPDFRARFADEKREHEAGAMEREAMAQQILDARKGRITVKDMADILRCVGDEDSYDVTEGDRSTRVCMHAGPTETRFWHATGAMISQASESSLVVWLTGTSATDLSCFKPLFFDADMPDLGPAPEGTYTEGSLWWKHEHLHRRAMAAYKEVKPQIRADFDRLEGEFFAEAPRVKTGGRKLKTEFVLDCWKRAEAMTDDWIARLKQRNYVIEHAAYRAMWDRFNREGSFPI
jgi:secernin